VLGDSIGAGIVYELSKGDLEEVANKKTTDGGFEAVPMTEIEDDNKWKKIRQKNTKNSRKMPNTTTFWDFWSKIQIQITNDLKLTILVLLWKRACYREKAKKKSHAQKYYHLKKIQRLGPRKFEFSRSKFFLVKTKKNLVKTQQNKTKPIFLAVPLYNYHNWAIFTIFFC
jgi:hypothetical protein